MYSVYDFIINIVSAYSGGIGGRALMALSWLLSWLLVSFLLHVKYTVSRGGAPIGAGGHDSPHFSRQRRTGGHNLGIIHISHIALITPLH